MEQTQTSSLGELPVESQILILWAQAGPIKDGRQSGDGTLRIVCMPLQGSCSPVLLDFYPKGARCMPRRRQFEFSCEFS